MVWILPPVNTDSLRKYPKLEKGARNTEPIKYPDLKPVQDNLIHRDKAENQKVKDFHIFKLPMNVFFQNMANTLLLTLHDIVKVGNYSNPKKFMSIFLKDDRLFYLGVFLIILTIVISIFFS